MTILLKPTESLAGKSPAIIYLTDFEGANSFVKSEVAQLQKMGVEVFVIDFLENQKDLDFSSRQFKWARLDQDLVHQKIQKVIAAMNARKEKDIDLTRVGVIAESDAASYAIQVASENPSFRGVILRNPNLVFDKKKFATIKSKFLLVLAEKKYDSAKLVAFKAQLKQANVQMEIIKSNSADRFYDLSQTKRYIASDAESYKNGFYDFIKRFITLEMATKY